jgi:hypothetical protein
MSAMQSLVSALIDWLFGFSRCWNSLVCRLPSTNTRGGRQNFGRKEVTLNMKTGVMTLVLVLLVGFLPAGCATVNRLNAEYEEEVARFDAMSAEEKAEFENIHDPYRIEWGDIDRDGE